jgi:hypothetical protein
MKTPKEEAKELVVKYLNIEFGLLTDNQAKQCAFICVDEIIKTYIDIDPKLKYWQEVKQEIEKL